MAVAATAAIRKRRSNAELSANMREALMEATVGALAAHGHAKATTQEICRRAGVTSGAIQHHFHSKDELLLATFDKLRFEVEELLISGRPKADRREEWCIELVTNLWERYYGAPRYSAFSEIVTGSRGDPALCRLVKHARRSTLKRCEDAWLDMFQDRRPRVRDAMHFVLSVLRGVAFYDKNDPEDARLVRAQLVMAASHLHSLLEER